MKRSVTLAIAMALALFTSTGSKAADIVDTADAAGNFKTLAAALGAADLAGALEGDGPFTVFAPTDDAFAKLPAGTVESLLKPENKAKLQAILTHHVIGSQVPASTVVTLSGATTLGGQRVDIKADDSGVTVDGANVVQTDIACDNGLIHVIDTVILPADKNLVETAAAAGTFDTLIAAAKAAGLAGALSGSDNLTVFAPTDDAFAKLPEGTVESLLKPENKQQLVNILKYHVVSGRVYSETAVTAGSTKTLEGSPVTITADADGARVNQSNLIATDLDASNGVIHVIDTVLMPPAKSAEAGCHREVCQTLAAAIAKGAPMFNAGHHAACADLYMRTMSDLMHSELDSSMKHHVSTVLNAARHQHRSTDRAWTLRRGMDQMFVTLQPSN
ncbi:MAG: fasciclin domain-containing protein [Phycisphaera sp. RhM]|nr:fasciclin domain-containing protein [Phycisphaera sp. RhM]